jgi:hypothetical protein
LNGICDRSWWYIDHYNSDRPLNQVPPAGRTHPSAEVATIRMLRHDRRGSLMPEYAQAA